MRLRLIAFVLVFLILPASLGVRGRRTEGGGQSCLPLPGDLFPPPDLLRLERCRELFFVEVDEEARPSLQPDVPAADDCFADFIADNSSPDLAQAARVFRAVTRLLRIAEEQPPGGIVEGLLDGFGFANDPLEAHQVGGPNEDGRSIFDWTAVAPTVQLGTEDGSFDRGITDPSGQFFLDPGDYLLAVGPCCGDPASALTGERTGANSPVSLVDAGGFCSFVGIDAADYRISFQGNVELPGAGGRVVEGELRAVPGGATVDLIPFTVNGGERIFIDALAWEALGSSSSLPCSIDLNGDGDFTSIFVQLQLFLDDGDVDAGDLLFEFSESSRPNAVVLPDDSPTTGDFQAALDALAVVDAIDASVADLAFVGMDYQDEIRVEELADFGISVMRPLQLDQGDAKLLEAWLLAWKAAILIEQAYEVDFDLDALSPLEGFPPFLAIQAEILDTHPDLLTLLPGGPARIAEAEAANVGAIDAYLEASASIRAETDDQYDDFVTLEPVALAAEAELRAELSAAKRSRDGRRALFCRETGLRDELQEVVDDGLWRVNQMSCFPGGGPVANLSAFYNAPFDLRPILPEVEFDLGGQKNGFLMNQCPPDPTFGGVITRTSDNMIDCDGDGLFAGDNCTSHANGPALGTCLAGEPVLAEGVCTSDAECGPGGVCSLAQEDGDGDGHGDVCDNCPGTPNPDQADSDEIIVIAAPTLEGALRVRFEGPEEAFGIVFDVFENFALSLQMSGSQPEVVGASGLEFSCGGCGEATFDDSVAVIDDTSGLCAFADDVLEQIVTTDQPLCMRDTEGIEYELDFLSYKRASGICVDADGGDSCTRAGGVTSYQRTGDAFFDEFDLGGGLEISLQGGPPTLLGDLSNVEGRRLEFDCGTCADASFSDPIDRFGDVEQCVVPEIGPFLRVCMRDKVTLERFDWLLGASSTLGAPLRAYIRSAPDGVGDVCDSCPTVPGVSLVGTDTDGDGVFDDCDNCTFDPNPRQLNADRLLGQISAFSPFDAITPPDFSRVGLDEDPLVAGEQLYGNVCDPDFDLDGDVDLFDAQVMDTVVGAGECVGVSGVGALICSLADLVSDPLGNEPDPDAVEVNADDRAHLQRWLDAPGSPPGRVP